VSRFTRRAPDPNAAPNIRIGSVKGGNVTAFIPEPSVESGVPEAVGVDDVGNVYAGLFCVVLPPEG
jgi:hypothetical protein